jgi:hypothetical protein
MRRGVGQLVRNTGPVVLGGIDVVHALFDRVAKDVQRLLTVEWWPECAGTGKTVAVVFMLGAVPVLRGG